MRRAANGHTGTSTPSSAWLERQPRGIYHQHSWTTSCGLRHIEAAKALGFKTVLTVHVPAFICLRGTMMEFGSEPCDGRVEPVRCAACWSQGRGLPRAAARVFSRVPQIVSAAAYRSGAENRLVTALAARELAATRQRQIAGMAAATERIVAVCDWLADVLRKNNIADDKLVVSRQGIDRSFVPQARSRSRGRADKISARLSRPLRSGQRPCRSCWTPWRGCRAICRSK